MALRGRKWFTNRGQMLQIGISILALIIGGRNAWKEMLASQYLSLGAVLFYLLVGLVVLSFFWMVQNNWASPHVSQEGSVLRAQLADGENELLCRDRPQLLIEYTRREPPEGLVSREALRFSIDGQAAVMNPQLAPLKWEDRRPIVMTGEIGTLTAGTSVVKEVWLESPEERSSSLFVSLRRDVPAGVRPSVTATYEDTHGRKFSREFFLTAQIDESIVWAPGPVKARV